MLQFGIQFFICNIVIAFMVGVILLTRKLFENHLSSRMKYHLWFIFLILLGFPFLPLQFPDFWQYAPTLLTANPVSGSPASNSIISTPSTWMNDFAISITKNTTPGIGELLLALWGTGMFVMLSLIIKSQVSLHRLKGSALPLQNVNVQNIYAQCLQELNIRRKIPIYSTAFLKSPMISGLFSPRIYLPIHLIADYNGSDIRYMLLHELQHYKHKDALANCLMNLTGILYWFNPLVWYDLKEMGNDREIACDTAVLEVLHENDYINYGNTLINFAEKVSRMPFPFATGIGGNMKQMRRRILNIAVYESPSLKKRLRSTAVFCITVLLLAGFMPILSSYASEGTHYSWNPQDEAVTTIDLSSYFNGYTGSFVLYDSENNRWDIYNQDGALLRKAPDSTYKIYDALFGLESGIITPRYSQMSCDNTTYPFESWNKDQDLYSAMENSVNWYFENLGKQIGLSSIKNYIHDIDYGNQAANGDTYWMESSLKISPIEQVELLHRFYDNDFHFQIENIQTVKNALHLSNSSMGSLYGKTGTGRVNNEDINGWFIGYVESSGHTYFFVTNIQSVSDATGSKASEITLKILSDLNLWQ